MRLARRGVPLNATIWIRVAALVGEFDQVLDEHVLTFHSPVRELPVFAIDARERLRSVLSSSEVAPSDTASCE